MDKVWQRSRFWVKQRAKVKTQDRRVSAMKKALALLFVLAMVAILVLGTVNLALASPGSQKWYLRHIDYGGTKVDDSAEDVNTPHLGDWTMSKLSGDSNWAVEIHYVSGYNVAWWYAENATQTGVTFGSGDDWTVFLEYINTSLTATETLHAQIFKVDSSGNYTALTDQYAGTGITANWADTLTYTLNGKAVQSLAVGDRLALRLRWTESESDELGIKYNGGTGYGSYVQSPESDPAYPVPELSTIILISIGLLGLGGYVWLSRRKKAESICG